MNKPQLLALSALVAAALAQVSIAQTPSTPSSNERSVTTPSDRPATSPSRTDRDTSSNARSNDRASRSAEKADSKLARGERNFIEHMLEGNLAEVQLGKLAQDKAQNGEVKKFAQRMIDDHGKAQDQLKDLAQAHGIRIPDEPGRAHKRDMTNLEKLSGADFDKKYVGDMVKEHEKDVKDAQKMAKDAKDPQVKAFAEKTAPILEQHLTMVRQLADSIGAPRGGRNNKSAAVNPGRDSSASTGSSSRDRSASSSGSSR